MKPNHEESDLLIGTLLSQATTTNIKHVLQTYDPKLPSTSNISKLSSTEATREQLQETVNFLEQQYPDHKQELTISQSKRNKKEYAELIVNFILKTDLTLRRTISSW